MRIVLFSLLSMVLGSAPASGQLTSEKQDGALVIKLFGQPVLSYQYEIKLPPNGIDEAYKRSGFIHPLRTLSRSILTQIQPEDHYHHYGIWNPWTHVLYNGDTLDFWNLKKKEGTVRFAGFKDIDDTGFEVFHEHVVFKDGLEKVVLNELQTIQVTPGDSSYYILDISLKYECATSEPFKILEYRYGGLGWRTTEEWHKDNSKVLTSEGYSRNDSDNTRAQWCMVQGKLGNGNGGILIMSNSENYNHPEPLRIWPDNDNERGDVFVNFSPTKNMDWVLEAGNTYTLQYRLIVFDGEFSKQDAVDQWLAYTNE